MPKPLIPPKPPKQQPPTAPDVDGILGPHPAPPNFFGRYLATEDGFTDKKVAHRAMTERTEHRALAIRTLRDQIIVHHTSPEALARAELVRAQLMQDGRNVSQFDSLRRFPRSSNTRRGNLAEIVLAEYVVATSRTTLPVYRLRYNPNVDQSMKGDDVLAFDLDSNPVRIVVGESKFRGTSAPQAVRDIVDGLLVSHAANLPISLPFVAERLFEQGQAELGEKVLNCSLRFAEGRLKIDYVGLLLSDTHARRHVKEHGESAIRRLVLLSLAVDAPEDLVDTCYDGLI